MSRTVPPALTFISSTFCPHCIYVFCVDLSTKSDYFLIGFYNRGRKYLLRGTDWVFKSDTVSSLTGWTDVQLTAIIFRYEWNIKLPLCILGMDKEGGGRNSSTYYCCRPETKVRVSFTRRSIFPWGKEQTGPHEQVAGGAPGSVWIFWKKEKSPTHAEKRMPGRPTRSHYTDWAITG
jgi:hypothetical protein